MADIIDIRTCDDPRDVVHRVVELLAAGELIGLPTETSYVLAAQATHADAVSRLSRISSGPSLLAVRSPDEALDFASEIDADGERLIRRLLPGLVILKTPIGSDAGLTEALPPEVRRAVLQDHHVRLRMPGHDVVAAIQRLTPSPLVLSTEPAEAIIASPAALLRRFGPVTPLVIDDGPPLHPGVCTTVCIESGGWSVSEPGLLDETAIRERTNFGVVFVCTGNTCRSPLAEAIFRKLLAERLDCSEEALADHGFCVSSAGLAAGYGMPAAAESLAMAEEFGLNLTHHSSRPLSDDLLDRSDFVFTMTAGHRESILATRPDLAGRVQLLSREGLDIVDPIGGGPGEYERCRLEIERELLVLLEQMPIDRTKTRD